MQRSNWPFNITNIFGCCSFDEAHSIAEAHRSQQLDQLQTPRQAQPDSKWEAIVNDARSTQVNARRSGERRDPAFSGRAPGFIPALIRQASALMRSRHQELRNRLKLGGRGAVNSKPVY